MVRVAAVFRSVLTQYATFEGRASRDEFWIWYGATGLSAALLATVAALTGAPVLYFLYLVLYLGVLVPSLAVSTRRLHDTGRSGLTFLIAFVPLLGACLLLYFWSLAGDPAPNRFGRGRTVYGEEIQSPAQRDQPPPRENAPILLERLKALYDAGAITAAEYHDADARLREQR